jgi:O-antigen/teichoic acid export membrane protein
MYILTQILGTIASLVIARSVGPAGRGSVTTLVVWAQLLGWIAAFSLDKAIVVLSRSALSDSLDPDAALAWSRRVVSALGVPVAAICFVMGQHLFHDWVWSIFLIVGSLATANGALSSGWLLAHKRVKGFIIYQLAQPLLYFMMVSIVALVLRHVDVETRVMALALATTASLVIPVACVSIITPWRIRAKVPSRGLVRFAFSSQAAIAMLYLNSRLDILTLSLLSSPREVGLYSVGYSIGQATVLLGSAGIVRGIMGRSTNVDKSGIVLTGVLGIVIACLSPFVIPLIFGQAFDASIRVAQIIAIGGVVSYAMQSASGRLLGAGRPWLMALAEGVGAIAFGVGISVSRQIDSVAISSVLSFGASLIVAQLCLRRVKGDRVYYPDELPGIPE